MYVDQVSALFLQFCDEQDTTFMSPAQRQFYLKTAYDAFRNEVMSIDTFYYSTAANLTLSDQNSYPLDSGATILMGPNAAAATRVERILRLAILNDSGDQTAFFSRVADLKEVRPAYQSVIDYAGCYQISNRTILFDRKVTGTLQLSYVAESSVDWTKETAGDNEYIDDLNQFHDIIARIAMRDYYSVRDGALSDANLMTLDQRLGKLRTFLNNGWLQDGANVIFDVYSNG